MTAGAIKLGDGTAPAWSGAGEGVFYFDSGTGAPVALNSQTGATVPLGGGGGGTVGPSNVLYVDVAGNDFTAVRGDASKPYATVQAAVAAAQNLDQVRIGPGQFNCDFQNITSPAAALVLSIVGSGQDLTALIRTAGSGDFISAPSTQKLLSISDLSVIDLVAGVNTIAADGLGAGTKYLENGLWLVNVRVRAASTSLALKAAFVGALYADSLDLSLNSGASFSVNTCRITRFDRVSWGNVFYLKRNVSQPDSPSSLSATHIDRITNAYTVAGNVYLGNQPNVEFDANCYLGSGLSVDPFGPFLDVFGFSVPKIRFYGTAVFAIDFFSGSAGMPDTPTALLLDFSGAKTASLAVKVSGFTGNRQDVRADGLICPTITAADGIDIYDRFADGAQPTTITASGPLGNDGTYNPARWSGVVTLAGAAAPAPFGFYATNVPHSVVATTSDLAMGSVAAIAIANDSATVDASTPLGDVYVAAFWKQII